VWRDIQAEGRKLLRKFIARWSFKKDCDGTLTVSKCCKKERAHSDKAQDGSRHNGESAKGPRERGQE